MKRSIFSLFLLILTLRMLYGCEESTDCETRVDCEVYRERLCDEEPVEDKGACILVCTEAYVEYCIERKVCEGNEDIDIAIK